MRPQGALPSISLISAVLKPDSSTFREYVDARNPGTEKRPSLSVTTTRCAQVALKFLSVHSADNASWVNRFVNEVRLARQLLTSLQLRIHHADKTVGARPRRTRRQ